LLLEKSRPKKSTFLNLPIDLTEKVKTPSFRKLGVLALAVINESDE
jgi:hypothetical protein